LYYLVTCLLAGGFSLSVALGSVADRVLGMSPSWQQSLGVALIVWLGVVLLLWLRDLAQQAIDRRFFREKYQLDKALQRMNRAVGRFVDPDALAEMMLGSCRDVLGVGQTALYLRSSAEGPFRLVSVDGPEDVPLQFMPDSELVEALIDNGTVLRVSPGRRDGLSPVQAALRTLRAHLVHALEGDGRIEGLVALGPKRNGAPFSAEDLTFLNAMGQITKVALHSAKIHQDATQLNEELQLKVEKIASQRRQIEVLQAQLNPARQSSTPQATAAEDEPEFRRDLIRGNSPATRRVLATVRKVAGSSSSVLIRGESGTGKELLAQILHGNSARRDRPIVAVHCAALSAGLLESELFGHVKGAFTGAHRDKVGRFEAAHGGTLFLDEIGDISLETQVKLLRVLQERKFEPVGSAQSVEVDVRLVTATHQDLEALIAAGRFREDLYYRLNVISIVLPPLRERREDIFELAAHFLTRSARRQGKHVLEFDEDALTALERHPWPGNIRELENVIERAVVL
ncbi:MAG: sigma-54 interaction domain-containing protein, partial [Planctomycetaceae bacterium]